MRQLRPGAHVLCVDLRPPADTRRPRRARVDDGGGATDGGRDLTDRTWRYSRLGRVGRDLARCHIPYSIAMRLLIHTTMGALGTGYDWQKHHEVRSRSNGWASGQFRRQTPRHCQSVSLMSQDLAGTVGIYGAQCVSVPPFPTPSCMRYRVSSERANVCCAAYVQPRCRCGLASGHAGQRTPAAPRYAHGHWASSGVAVASCRGPVGSCHQGRTGHYRRFSRTRRSVRWQRLRLAELSSVSDKMRVVDVVLVTLPPTLTKLLPALSGTAALSTTSSQHPNPCAPSTSTPPNLVLSQCPTKPAK